MKSKTFISNIVLVIILVVTSSGFTISTINYSASASENLPQEFSDLLSEYSQALATTGKLNQPTQFSPEMGTLVAERQNYYRNFFEKGLHANLISVDSKFKGESAIVTQMGNVYKVQIFEEVKMLGKPIVTLPDDYPLIQAATWAIKQTNNTKVKSYLEQYIVSMTRGVEKSARNGVEIVSLIKHEIEIVKEKEFTKITKDTFSDQSTDNHEGFDNVNWTEKGFKRSNIVWQIMPDYVMYTLPVEIIGKRLLKDYESIVEASLIARTSTSNNFSTNRDAAVWYVQKFTSNPQYWQYISCTPEPSVLQNTVYYNPEYSAIWGNIGCNDCTDFVSQALNYGGFPEDSDWYADLYNIDWIRPYRLSQYYDTTINRGDFVGNLTSLQIGDLAFIYDYEYADEDLNWKHVVMVSEINPHRYSGHTNDRYNYPFSLDFNRFMVVSYYPKSIYLPLIRKDGTYLLLQPLNPYPSPNENSASTNINPYPAP